MAKKRTRLWLLPVMLAAAGFCYLDNCTVQTTFHTLCCANLPEAFSGLRIVQISDLHGRVFGKEHAALLDAVRAVKPDLIALTGDLADEDTPLPSLRPLLAGLTALAPVYYVTGNHEWVISRAVRQTLCDLLDGYGVIRLENDYRVLERDGQRLVIAGVDDPNGPADQKTAPELVREIRSAYGEDVFILALCHRNDQLPLWAGLDVPVVLAGHAHGGIVRIPGVGGLIGTDRHLFPDFVEGKFYNGNYTMIVSRGLGNSVPIPRIFNRPEIVCVTLKAEK